MSLGFLSANLINNQLPGRIEHRYYYLRQLKVPVRLNWETLE